MFICAGESEQFDFAVPVGIGLEDVAINLTQLCMLKKPEFLFFVGTAGSYGEKALFEIIESKSATQIEQSFFSGDAYTPIDNMITVDTYGGVEDTSPTVPNLQTRSSSRLLYGSHVSRETLVNSSNYITTNKEIGKFYLKKNIHLENMEFYAVLKVAQKFAIPAAGAFVVTNYCDEYAHRDFLKNHKEAMKRLTEYIKK